MIRTTLCNWVNPHLFFFHIYEIGKMTVRPQGCFGLSSGGLHDPLCVHPSLGVAPSALGSARDREHPQSIPWAARLWRWLWRLLSAAITMATGGWIPGPPIPLPGNPPLSLDPSEERRLFDLWVQAKSGEALLAPCWPGKGPGCAARWMSCAHLSGLLSHLAGSYARLLRIKTAGIACR